MAQKFLVVSSSQYLDDKDRFRNNPRVLKDLTKLERQLSRTGTREFKDLHRIGDDLWTIRAGEGRRLLVRAEGDVVELVRFDEHDDAYMAAGRTSLKDRVVALAPTASASESPARHSLFEGHTDDFLLRLGVPCADLRLVREILFPDEVYEHLDVLGDDLAQRLLMLQSNPPAQVLAEYENRGRDDASVALLEQIEAEASDAKARAETAQADVQKKQAELVRAQQEIEDLKRSNADADRLQVLEERLSVLSAQIPELIKAARKKAEKAESRATGVAEKKVKTSGESTALGALATRVGPDRSMRLGVSPDTTSSLPSAAAQAPGAIQRPGTVWARPQGRERWRLSPSSRTLTRLRDNRDLSGLVGATEARRIIDQFLAVRPSGGRVWVDEQGHAATLLDGQTVYLGQLQQGAEQLPEADGTLRSAVTRVLMDAPDSTAREIAFFLSRAGHPGLTRSDVNSLLYREKSSFCKDTSTVPRWRLKPSALGTSDELPHKVSTPKTKAVRSAAGGAYADLLGRGQEKAQAVARVRQATVPRTAPVQVLDLMDWQREAIAAWYASGCHGIVEAVTGTGKTHVGLEAVAHAAAQGQRSTVLVPSVDLQDQWAARFHTFLPHLRVARLGGKNQGHPATSDVTIAVVNSALKTDLSSLSPDSLLVADEVHRYGAEQFQYALRAMYQRRLGLTATLERNDEAIEEVLTPYFGGTVLKVGFDRAITEGVVAPFRLIMAPVAMSEDEEGEYESLTKQISNGLKVLRSEGALGGGDGASMIQQLGRLRGAGGRVGAAARSAESGMRQRRQLLANLEGKLDAVEEMAEIIDESQGAVLFTQSKEVAEEAALRLREWGVAASALHSDMSAPERRSALSGLEAGQLQALAAPKLLDEGIDVPTVDLGIVMTASRSRRQMVQRLGRVIRRKADGRPVDFVILYAADTVEDPDSGVHEGFFDLVGEVATNRHQLKVGWTSDDVG